MMKGKRGVMEKEASVAPSERIFTLDVLRGFDFEWPEEYRREQEALTRYYTDHPDEYQAMISLGEQLAAIADLPEDSPEVERLAQAYVRHFENHPPSEILSEESPWSSEPLGGMFANLLTSSMSPAQRRVLMLANEHFAREGDK